MGPGVPRSSFLQLGGGVRPWDLLGREGKSPNPSGTLHLVKPTCQSLEGPLWAGTWVTGYRPLL